MIERFSEDLVPTEKKIKSEDAAEFIAEHLAVHRRRTIGVGISAVVALAMAAGVFMALQRVGNSVLHDALIAVVTMRVFAAAAIGYVFFMFAMRSLLLLLTLWRIDEAVRSVALALLVNVVVGFLCSRALHYAAAVAGLVAGALVMNIVAGRAVRQTLERLDYYYFAAF